MSTQKGAEFQHSPDRNRGGAREARFVLCYTAGLRPLVMPHAPVGTRCRADTSPRFGVYVAKVVGIAMLAGCAMWFAQGRKLEPVQCVLGQLTYEPGL